MGVKLIMNERKYRRYLDWIEKHAPIDYDKPFIIGWAGMLTLYLPKIKYVGNAREVIGHD